MKRTLGNVSVALVSLVVAFSLAECGTRVYYGDFTLRNHLGEERNLFRSAYPAEYDAELGWVPRPGVYDTTNVWGTTVTILEHGIRSNGTADPPPADSVRILAVGDSFTFGDQVSDGDTWPAALERLTGYTVLNGGVFGYGLDQSYLRAERLMEAFRPDILVFSFFSDDVKRCEMSERMGVPKPYFDPSGVLSNTPVPRPPHTTTSGRLHDALGHSLLVHRLMLRLNPNLWLKGTGWQSVRVHSSGMRVARRLIGRLGEAAAHSGVRHVYVLVQYAERTAPQDFATIDYVTAGHDPATTTIVDLRDALAELKRKDADAYGRLFEAHMTPEGNAFVARVLRDAMAAGGLPPPPR